MSLLKRLIQKRLQRWRRGGGAAETGVPAWTRAARCYDEGGGRRTAQNQIRVMWHSRANNQG
jgi:hypothetical protein